MHCSGAKQSKHEQQARIRPEVDLSQSSISVDVIPDIQNLISINAKSFLYHGSAASTVQPAIHFGVHGRPHQAILCHYLIQAHLAVEELRLACLHNHLQSGVDSQPM